MKNLTETDANAYVAMAKRQDRLEQQIADLQQSDRLEQQIAELKQSDRLDQQFSKSAANQGMQELQASMDRLDKRMTKQLESITAAKAVDTAEQDELKRLSLAVSELSAKMEQVLAQRPEAANYAAPGQAAAQQQQGVGVAKTTHFYAEDGVGVTSDFNQRLVKMAEDFQVQNPSIPYAKAYQLMTRTEVGKELLQQHYGQH